MAIILIVPIFTVIASLSRTAASILVANRCTNHARTGNGGSARDRRRTGSVAGLPAGRPSRSAAWILEHVGRGDDVGAQVGAGDASPRRRRGEGVPGVERVRARQRVDRRDRLDRGAPGHAPLRGHHGGRRPSSRTAASSAMVGVERPEHPTRPAPPGEDHAERLEPDRVQVLRPAGQHDRIGPPRRRGERHQTAAPRPDDVGREVLLLDGARSDLPAGADLPHRGKRHVAQRRLDAESPLRPVEDSADPSLSSRIAEAISASRAPGSRPPTRRPGLAPRPLAPGSPRD